MIRLQFTSAALTVLIFGTLVVSAQTEKGKFLLGGQYGLDFSSNSSTYIFTTNNVDKGKSISLHISPMAGYCVFRNTLLGLEILYQYDKKTEPPYLGYANYMYDRSFSFIPFLRYYFSAWKIRPYAHFGIGPGWGKTGSRNYNFPEVSQNTKLLFHEFRGGFGIFVNEHIAFDLGLGYESTTTSFKVPMTDGSFDKWKLVTKGIGTTVGITIIL